MAKQSIKFSVQGVGGGRGPAVRSQAAVLQSYADYIATKKKKKKDKDDDENS